MLPGTYIKAESAQNHTALTDVLGAESKGWLTVPLGGKGQGLPVSQCHTPTSSAADV